MLKEGIGRFLWDEGACVEGGAELWCGVTEMREEMWGKDRGG